MANFPRRSLFKLAGAAALLRSRAVPAQQPPTPGQQPTPGQPGVAPARPPAGRGGGGNAGNPEPFPGLERRSTVAITQGEDRRKNVYNALMAVDKDLQPKLKLRKYVVIKPNFARSEERRVGKECRSR